MISPLLRRSVLWLSIVAAVALVVTGLGRINFNVEILKLLPQHLPSVQGLSLYLRHFQTATELVCVVEAPTPEAALSTAETLTARLDARPDLALTTIMEPPGMHDAGTLAELAAFALINAPPARVAAWINSLSPDNITATLSSAADELENETDPAHIATLAYDPLDLRAAAGLDDTEWAADLGDAGFASPDGRTRILYIEAPARLTNYRKTAQWLAAIKAIASDVRASLPGSVQIRFTGEPAFVAEIATGMEADMWFSAISSTLLIAALFRLTFRSFRPLLLLLTSLLLTFTATLGLCGWLLGTVTAVSVGFAAILIGLSVDYGFLVYRRAQEPDRPSWRRVSRDCLPGIAWAAITTSVAFFALGFTSLPGLGQLGLLVGCGVVVGAVIMLTVFPWLNERLARLRPTPPDAGRIEPILDSPAVVLTGRIITLALVIVCAAGLLFRGLPRIDSATASLRPRNSEAYAALDDVQSIFGKARNLRTFIVAGNDIVTTGLALKSLVNNLHKARQAGLIDGCRSSLLFWPFPDIQASNLAALRALTPRLPAIMAAGQTAGFEPAAFAFLERTTQTLAAWQDRPLPATPASAGARWILRRCVSITDQGCAALLPVKTAAPEAALRPFTANAFPVSWSELSAALSDTMPREFAILGVVIAVGVGTLLLLALRSARAAALAVLSLALVFITLLGAMSWLGLTWNLFNLASVLLLAGMGVDYSIHLLHAAAHGGNTAAVRGVVVLCGLSTAAGFASISTASNLGLASLGVTCALGILMATLVAVFLLPTGPRAQRHSARPTGRTSPTATSTLA